VKLKKLNKKTILNKKIAIKIMMIKSERLKILNNDEIEKKNQFLKLITIKKIGIRKEDIKSKEKKL
jgi:hypothetical protein